VVACYLLSDCSHGIGDDVATGSPVVLAGRVTCPTSGRVLDPGAKGYDVEVGDHRAWRMAFSTSAR